MVVNTNPGRRVYEFVVEGELAGDWYDWLDGLAIEARGGVTVIRGPVVDQSALYGMIARFAGLGLTLLSLNCREVEAGC